MHDLLIVSVVALVTIGLRFLPFILFPDERPVPKIISHLSTLLPAAVMGMLVVYCLKGVDLTKSPFGLPELLSCILVVLIHCWKRNTLLSILSGTLCYVFLVQAVF